MNDIMYLIAMLALGIMVIYQAYDEMKRMDGWRKYLIEHGLMQEYAEWKEKRR